MRSALPFVCCLLALLHLGQRVEAQCQANFVQYGGSCYFYFYGVAVNWTSAVEACRYLNSYVTIIDNNGEYLFLKSLLRGEPRSSFCPWVGGVYVQERTVDGRNVTYFDYSDGDFCTCLLVDLDYTIVKGECQISNAFVCEQTLTPTPAPSTPPNPGPEPTPNPHGRWDVGGALLRASDLLHSLLLGSSSRTGRVLGLMPREVDSILSTVATLGADPNYRTEVMQRLVGVLGNGGFACAPSVRQDYRTADLDNTRAMMRTLGQESAYSPGLFQGLINLMARHGYSCALRPMGFLDSLGSLLFGEGGTADPMDVRPLPVGYDVTQFWREVGSLEADPGTLGGLLDAVFEFLADNHIVCTRD